MNTHEASAAYRASVAAIIVDANKKFFLVRQPKFRPDEWDFVKGGMFKSESEEETIKRELREELGENINYKILRRSSWNIIYEWPIEHQLEKGFRGQARISYWVKYLGGEITPNTKELLETKWFDESAMQNLLITSGAREPEVKIFLDDWAMIKKEFSSDFASVQ